MVYVSVSKERGMWIEIVQSLLVGRSEWERGCRDWGTAKRADRGSHLPQSLAGWRE